MRSPSRNNSGPGHWFLTINAVDKRELFGKVVNGRVEELNVVGQIVRDCWQEVPLHFPHVAPDAFVVMPNHMHSIVPLTRSDERILRPSDRIEQFGAPVVGSLATIVRSFTAATTRSIREHIGERIVLWQSRFYDRRIWDTPSLERARRYIKENPKRWEERGP